MKVVCLVFAVHFAASFVNAVEIKEFKSDGKLLIYTVQLVFVVTLPIRDSLANHHENSKINQRGLGRPLCHFLYLWSYQMGAGKIAHPGATTLY